MPDCLYIGIRKTLLRNYFREIIFEGEEHLQFAVLGHSETDTEVWSSFQDSFEFVHFDNGAVQSYSDS
jgi:hypothetical protein